MKFSAFYFSLFVLLLSLTFSIFEPVLVYSVFFSIIPIIFFYFNKNIHYELSFSSVSDSFKLFVLVVIISLITVFLLSLLGMEDLNNVKTYIFDKNLIILFAAISLSPIMEELFFRAFLIEFILKIKFLKNDTIRALIPSLIFTSLHLAYNSITEVIGVFLIAMAFSYYYLTKRQIVPLIITHFLFNISALILYSNLY